MQEILKKQNTNTELMIDLNANRYINIFKNISYNVTVLEAVFMLAFESSVLK